MIITKIELENIRSHANSIVELNKGISVFTGRTGCGKSTILMALEYALFGSDSGLSSGAVLRRAAQKGRICLEFSENGDSYKIIRGLKKQGNNIVVDTSALAVLKNDVVLPLLGRASDINQKVLEIIGYPEDIKAKDLFETTSYTKQDEIRALIQMSGEKRQEHIDKILQLSKYKDTWDNMKDVVSFFNNEISEKKIRLERLESLQEEILKIEKKMIETESVFEENNRALFVKKQKHRDSLGEVEQAESEIKDMLEKRRKIDQLNGIISNLKKDLNASEVVIAAFEERINEFRANIAKTGRTQDFDLLQMRNIELLKEIELKKKELDKIKRDFEKIKNLGSGKCPACMQEVTSGHIETLNHEFESLMTEIETGIKELYDEQKRVEPEMRKSRLVSDLKQNLDTNLDKQKEKTAEKERKQGELASKQEELEKLQLNEEDFAAKEEALKNLKSKEKELFSAVQSIENVNRTLGEQLEYLRIEFREKKEVIDELEKSKESVQKLESATETLIRLREDIRNIREVIRRTFLEDFRQEFQKKFEEIRKYEDDYSVDILQDYEPIAFSMNGEEVPIANLSGGEKTSVALSYRLALADLAAQISSINQSEILILDEPTTGFDQEDVRALPPALRNIKTIPQIIIVTHEEELKNAADYKFEVTKENRESSISSSN